MHRVTVCILLALLLPTSAWARPNAPLGKKPSLALRGLVLPREAKLHNQLHQAFCSAFRCLTTKDPPELIQNAPTFSAHIQGNGRRKKLHLRFRTAPSAVESVWDLPIRRNRVEPVQLKEILSRALLQVRGLEAAAAPAGVPSAPAAPPQGSGTEAQAPTIAIVPSTPPAATPPAEAQTAASVAAPPWVEVEAGAGALNRDFIFSGVSQGTVRSFQGRHLPSLMGRVRISPLAGTSSALLQGVSLRGELERTVGAFATLDTSLPYPLVYQRIDAGLSWRFPLGDHVRLGPEVGYRFGSFVVGAASDGTTIPDLPNTSDNGLWAGVDFGLLFGRFSVELHGLYLPAVQMGPLFAAPFFPNGKANGLSADLSLHFRVVGPLELSLGGTFIRYTITLNAQPGDPVVALAASDQFLGGRGAIGVVF